MCIRDRNLKKVKRDGVVITDINPIIPPLISIGLGSYEPLESIFDTIASHCRLIKIDADELARKAGSILTKNVVMLGAFHALHVMPLREESIIAVIKETIKEKYVDMNMNAFAMGKEAVQQKDI